MEEYRINQSQPLRIESTEYACLITSRCVNSRLWLLHMHRHFRERALGFLAKYAKKYEVTLYSFVIFGNHYHLLAHFHRPNRAQFMRDFNARLSEGARMFIPEFEGGALFGRRFSAEIVPLDSDIEDRFIYCANQSVSAGVSHTPTAGVSFNSVTDALNGRVETYKVVNWSKYRSAKRSNPDISIERYTEHYDLEFSRLPGHREKTQAEYREVLQERVNEAVRKTVRERAESGKGFLPQKKRRRIKRGSKPKTTKTSTRDSKRPLVLTACRETRERILRWYFDIYYEFKDICQQYLNGAFKLTFPKGTHRPHAFKTVESAYV